MKDMIKRFIGPPVKVQPQAGGKYAHLMPVGIIDGAHSAVFSCLYKAPCSGPASGGATAWRLYDSRFQPILSLYRSSAAA